MRINLTDYNSSHDTSYRIYRSYAPLNPEAMIPFIVELPYGTEYWDDPSVELQRTVYYRVGIVHNGNEIIGPQYITQKRYYSGPQINKDVPDLIIRGNGQIGRYGTLLPEEVLPVQDILDFLEVGTAVPGDFFYEKCEYYDKVLFLPSKPIVNVSYKEMYLKGCANASWESTITPDMLDEVGVTIKQGKTFKYGSHLFKIRLMTRTEFIECYSKLFPESNYGVRSDIVLSRCDYYDTPIITTGRENGLDSFNSILHGDPGLDNWSEVLPTPLVIELVNRNEAAQPSPEVIQCGKPGKRTYYSNSVIINDRFHVFGGVEYIAPYDKLATDYHWSVDLNGEDFREHAPLSVPTSLANAWTDGTRIFVFGGVSEWNSPSYNYVSKHDTFQVWSDDNEDGLGEWTIIPTDAIYKFGSSVVKVKDTVTNIERIEIIGGTITDDIQASKCKYISSVTNLTGEFELKTNIRGINDIGMAYGQHKSRVYGVGGGRWMNSSSNTIVATNKDDVSDSWFRTITMYKGGYPATTSLALLVSWNSALYLISGETSDGNNIYQYIEEEYRWAEIPFMPGRNWIQQGSTMSVKDNIIMVFTASTGPWQDNNLTKLVLQDSIDSDLVAISELTMANIETQPMGAYILVEAK